MPAAPRPDTARTRPTPAFQRAFSLVRLLLLLREASQQVLDAVLGDDPADLIPRVLRQRIPVEHEIDDLPGSAPDERHVHRDVLLGEAHFERNGRGAAAIERLAFDDDAFV